MATLYLKQLIAAVAIASFLFGAISCRVVATPGEFYGSTTPPKQNILRYVNGDEPGSLDPPISTGQPEARIYMALYQGLIDYEPRTLQAIPALAERWDINNDSSEFVFHLRRNAVWSNRDPITAHDFVYSVRRGVSPALASQNAYLAYYIVYAEAYNRKAVFARDSKTKQFVLEKDVAEHAPAPASATDQNASTSISSEYDSGAVGPESLQGPDVRPTAPADTPFHQLMHSPTRLTLPGDEGARNKLLANNPTLQAALEGKEFVPVSAGDIGVEAIDDYTVRISLSQPAPYFLGLLGHQLFRLAPRNIIEKYGEQWTQPEHIVTCGPFKVKEWIHYSELVVERDPLYWDAANVRLDEIHFFVSQDNPTSLNLYKVGEADAVLNHAVPNAWLQVILGKKDYMDGPEAAIGFININVTKPPMNDVRVRRAFNMSIDKINYSKSRLVTKPLSAFTPEGIFPGYPQPKGDPFDPEHARKLLGEAGFPVTKQGDGFQCKSFPVGEVEYIFNTNSSNRAMAEFMQAQWKQNLGITVPLRSMESKTFLSARNKLDYKGFSIGLWGADYMDPFSFLGLFTTPDGSNGSGWFDPKYVALLKEANLTLDPQKRYELLAKAEKYLLDSQPIIPIETFAVNWLKKPYVKGMYPNAASLYPWKFVYIERDTSKWDYGVPKMSD
ncbi:MAG TPA: peptide ABC transporter substrate-binding protein [Pyrinomonadaceae bacterium]|jgi:ABC-type oligopeptide transport system substrate-binding subunit|nr:peptide ABC transporter substrate-binding protein [Pyrinomonadaceae bacterium]